MGNKNYVRGVKFERELVNEAREKALLLFVLLAVIVSLMYVFGTLKGYGYN